MHGFNIRVIMGLIELFLIAIGLSMDAFAVSVGKGLSVPSIKPKHVFSVGLWFGGFQSLMPLLGFLLGISFASFVENVDHWIAFVLLGIIGFNMIKESRSRGCCDDASSPDFSMRTMFMMAVATSIDALAVGVSFAFIGANITMAIIIIGIVTFIMSAIGLKIGNIFGCRYKSKAEFAGGMILILMGLKILLEHLLS